MSLCFLLGAGEGQRLRPYTEARPKPSLEFLTLPLAYYGFYLCRQAGIENFIMNKFHLPEQIEVLTSKLRKFCSSISTIDETAKLLGSGGALWNARETLKNHEYFLVANADEVLIPQDPKVLSTLIEKFQMDHSLCTLLTCDHSELLNTLKPVWVDDLGHVKGFGMEKPSKELKPVHYTGYKIFSTKILERIPFGESNIFYDVLTEAIKDGEKITTLHIDHCFWHETGNFDSFLSASSSLCGSSFTEINKRREYFNLPLLAENADGNSLTVYPENLIIPPNFSTEGINVIGDEVELGNCTHLKNTIIESRSFPVGNLNQTMVFREGL